MVSDELKELINQICKQGKMNLSSPASVDTIAKFETEQGIQLPTKFKEWLQYSDGGDLFLPAGLQIYGVTHKPLIRIDSEKSPDSEHLVIGALASGDPILCEKSGERIAIYNYEGGCIEEDEIYDDFFAFLNDLYNLLGIGE